MAGLRFSVAVFALCVAFAPWLSADVVLLTFAPNTAISASRTTVLSSKSVNSNTVTLGPSLISTMKFFTSKNHLTVASSSKHIITSTANISHRTVTPSRNHSMTQNVTSTILHNMTITPSHKHTATLTTSHNMTAVTSTPYHNKTVSPVIHNSTVMPPHNTTIMPSSAHTVMPVSSSVAPTIPPPQRGNFSVSNNGSACLFADMAVQFDVSYMKKNTSEHVKFNLPTTASSDGMCETNGSSSITLSWPQKEALFMLKMHFIQDSSVKETNAMLWKMDKLNLVINTKNNTMFPDAKESKLSFTSSNTQLKGPVGKAYRCEKGKLDFDIKDNKSQEAKIEILKYEFQPFDVKNGTLSDHVEHCPADNPTPHPTMTTPKSKSDSKVVPIAVGCSLAALVLIVLVGYLIGRRRSRNKSAGYRKL